MTAKSVVNQYTGEVLSEPPFVKLYYQAIANSVGMTAIECDVWMFLISKMDEENVSSIGKVQRQQFMEKKEIGKQHLSNTIKRLAEKGFIQVLSRGEYLVSPRYAAKARWESVAKIIWVHEFTNQGVENRVKFVEKDE